MKLEVFGNLEPPGKAFIQVAPEAKRARVRPIDVGWVTEGDQVHVDSLSSKLKEPKHEEQVFAAVVT